MKNYIDLRSDTVTKPSKGMREAIASAEVGDDVYGEDVTVNNLQSLVADLLGKESGLFVPSGTMGNQLCLKTHTEPGDEVIVESTSHIFLYETAAPSFISNIQLFPIKGYYGRMKLQDIADSIRPDVYYYPKTRLICLENTHNSAGGTVLDLDYIRDVHTLATVHGIKLHLDGARLWNASIASGVSMKEYGSFFDSINVCLSKGLGAPVGSVICGSKDFIERARKFRKILGGGMRQAGLLAAGGIYAINNNFSRLLIDHQRAKYLAESLSKIPEILIDLDSVQSNMVSFSLKNPKISLDDIINKLEEKEVLIGKGSRGNLRLVTHLDLNDDQVEKSIFEFKKLFIDHKKF